MIINFECRNCNDIFDYDVGHISQKSDEMYPNFENPVHCSNCGVRTVQQLYLTELGQTQMAEWFMTQ
jgi:hypothetical protein